MEALHSFKVTGCHDNNEAKTMPLPVLRKPRNPKQTSRTTSTPPGGAGSCGRVDVSKTSIAVLLLAAALLGCATPTVSRDYKLAAGAPTGLVVVSFTQPFATLEWTYRDLAERESVKRLATRMFGSDVIKNGDTLLYALLLPAGEYEFFSWYTPDSGHLSFSPLFPYAAPAPNASRADFSIRFRSVPGRATYIGNLYMSMAWETNRYALKIRDNRDTDIPLFRKHYPNIDAAQIDTRIMKDRQIDETVRAQTDRFTLLGRSEEHTSELQS